MLVALIATAALIVHLALMLAAGPLLIGLIRALGAGLAGRAGTPLLQPWRDLARLARKQPVVAENASLLFRAAPTVAFAAILAAAALVPSFALGMIGSGLADLVALVGLLALARCVAALAGLDAGTAFGGLGASRRMAFGTLAEPALLLVVFTLALASGTTNLDAVVAAFREGGQGLRISYGFALAAILAVAIADAGRLPVTGSATRAELTMTGEALALEYSGPDLALLQWAAALKLTLWLSLIASIFFPFGLATPQSGLLAWALALPVWTGKVVVLAVILTGFESAIAAMRTFRAAELLGLAAVLAFLGAVCMFVGQGLI